MFKYLSSNPCHLSSVVLSLNIPITIYYNNNIFLLTEIPVGITTILYHNDFRCVKNIRNIDIFAAQLAFWQHMYYAIIYQIAFSRNCYIICPIIFLVSKYYHKNNDTLMSNFLHSFIHYFLTIGTIFLNVMID